MKLPAKRDPEWLARRPQRLRSRVPFDALVIGVPDGDTIQVSRDVEFISGASIEYVRLAGVDAPEMLSRFVVGAVRAQLALHSLVFMKVVTVRPRRIWRDPYHRIVADVTFNGADVGAWLIDRGVAQPLANRRVDTTPIV